LISLVDEDRQWFKATKGVDAKQTDLNESVCSHAILEDGFLEIEDMSADPRTSDNPLHVGGPEVQFYAGANLLAPNGMPIGTLCILDSKPRRLSDFQRKALKTLSRQVMTQLELRKKLAQEEALKSEMDHRVMNSLQTIGSVMRVASRQVGDQRALDVLGIVERRIDAVASLHSELMGRDGQGSVEMCPYLDRVVSLLDDVSPDEITILIDAEDTVLEARKASAIGMIVSEFSANSIKHAFPDDRSGTVKITLKKVEPECWALICEDDGVGRQDTGEDTPEDSGLGQMLMTSAASQLEGQLEYTSGPSGTSLSVRFKK